MFLNKDDKAGFSAFIGNPPFQGGQKITELLSLGSVNDSSGQVVLTDEEIEQIVAQDQPVVASSKLNTLFHLVHPTYKLPQFTRRLRTFKAERGL